MKRYDLRAGATYVCTDGKTRRVEAIEGPLLRYDVVAGGRKVGSSWSSCSRAFADWIEREATEEEMAPRKLIQSHDAR